MSNSGMGPNSGTWAGALKHGASKSNLECAVLGCGLKQDAPFLSSICYCLVTLQQKGLHLIKDLLPCPTSGA